MAKVITSESDESLIVTLLTRKGLGSDKVEPKWRALRIGLALSLRLNEHPSEVYDECKPRKGEYALAQVTGEGQDEDFTDAYRALLSAYHGEDLFVDESRFVKLLQRHVRRGLAEIERGWRDSHDVHEYLYQELFGSANPSEHSSPADLSDLLESALRDNGVAASVDEVVEGPRLQAYRMTLLDAAQWKVLQRCLENLSVALGKGPVSAVQGNSPGRVDLLVPKSQEHWAPVTWATVAGELVSAKGELPVVLGTDVFGLPVLFDLAEAPHLLIGGTTGSGKSGCIHTIVCSLLASRAASELSLCLIDPKRVELTGYAALPNLVQKRVIQEADEALDVLHGMVHEMSTREEQLAKRGFKTLREWRSRGKDAPAYAVVVVEELADLLMQRPDIEPAIIRLAQKGRAAGIHLVLATQRPDSDTFSGLLRSNVPSRIALSVQKSSESRIILDEVGAEQLLGKGDMLVRLIGTPMRRVQGALVSPDEIAQVIKRAGRSMH